MPPIEIIVHIIVTGLSVPPVLVFTDDDAVTDSSSLYRVYCDFSNDVLGMGKNNPIAPWDALPTSAALSSAWNDTGLRSLRKTAAVYGPLNVFESAFGAPTSSHFRIARHC